MVSGRSIIDSIIVKEIHHRSPAIAPRRKYQKQSHETGVYGILNTATGKWYIGSSIELSKRMGRHLWELRSGRHHSPKLQRSFTKHGEGRAAIAATARKRLNDPEVQNYMKDQQFGAKNNLLASISEEVIYGGE